MNIKKLEDAIITFSQDGKKAYLNIPLKTKWLVIEAKLVPKEDMGD